MKLLLHAKSPENLRENPEFGAKNAPCTTFQGESERDRGSGLSISNQPGQLMHFLHSFLSIGTRYQVPFIDRLTMSLKNSDRTPGNSGHRIAFPRRLRIGHAKPIPCSAWACPGYPSKRFDLVSCFAPYACFIMITLAILRPCAG